MTQRNEWAIRFAAARRATDRALLAECERAIGLEEKSGVSNPKNQKHPLSDCIS